MTDTEKLEWTRVFAYVFGAGLVIATVVLIFAGYGGVAIGVWFWSVFVTVALIFRKVYLAGKRAGTKGDS